jgi:hypothetical protein
MTLQHALFSFNGRLGRRDFWLWMVSWLILMVVDFFFAAQEWITYQSAGFALVVLLWPTAADVELGSGPARAISDFHHVADRLRRFYRHTGRKSLWPGTGRR